MPATIGHVTQERYDQLVSEGRELVAVQTRCQFDLGDRVLELEPYRAGRITSCGRRRRGVDGDSSAAALRRGHRSALQLPQELPVGRRSLAQAAAPARRVPQRAPHPGGDTRRRAALADHHQAAARRANGRAPVDAGCRQTARRPPGRAPGQRAGEGRTPSRPGPR